MYTLTATDNNGFIATTSASLLTYSLFTAFGSTTSYNFDDVSSSQYVQFNCWTAAVSL